MQFSMHTKDQTSRNLAICLASLAGFLDAVGFLSLGGLFVSFMSGNSTRLGVDTTIASSGHTAMLAMVLILLFVVGVMLGQILRHLRARLPSTSVLMLVCLLLSLAAFTAELGKPVAAMLVVAIAMGASNNIFTRKNEVSIGVTYMTGTLVRFGQGLAGWLMGDRDRHWLPYLALWAGLVVGAMLGATAYRHLDLRAIWVAVALCPVLTLVMYRQEQRYPPAS